MAEKKKGKKSKKREATFEQKKERLGEIVEQLEDGGLSLDESLAAYEEGIGLYKECHKQLHEAEGKVEALVEEGEVKKERFDF